MSSDEELMSMDVGGCYAWNKLGAVQFEAVNYSNLLKDVLPYSKQLLASSAINRFLFLVSPNAEGGIYYANLDSVVSSIEADLLVQAQEAEGAADQKPGAIRKTDAAADEKVFLHIPVPGLIWHLSLTIDDNILLIATQTQFSFYTVESLKSAVIKKAAPAPLCTLPFTNDIIDIQLAFTLKNSYSFATLNKQGELNFYQLANNVIKSIRCYTHSSSHIRAFTYSPFNVDSVWIATADKSIFQLSLADCSVQRSIAATTNDLLSATESHSIHHIAADVLLVGYIEYEEDRDSDPRSVWLSAVKISTGAYAFYGDRMTEEANRLGDPESFPWRGRHRFESITLAPWNCAIIYGNRSSAIPVVGLSPESNFSGEMDTSWPLIPWGFETTPINVPSDAEYHETYPLAISVDRGNEKRLGEVEAPMPLVYLLTSDARLHLFSFVSNIPNQVQASKAIIIDKSKAQAAIKATAQQAENKVAANSKPSEKPKAIENSNNGTSKSAETTGGFSLPSNTTASAQNSVAAPFPFASKADNSFEKAPFSFNFGSSAAENSFTAPTTFSFAPPASKTAITASPNATFPSLSFSSDIAQKEETAEGINKANSKPGGSGDKSTAPPTFSWGVPAVNNNSTESSSSLKFNLNPPAQSSLTKSQSKANLAQATSNLPLTTALKQNNISTSEPQFVFTQPTQTVPIDKSPFPDKPAATIYKSLSKGEQQNSIAEPAAVAPFQSTKKKKQLANPIVSSESILAPYSERIDYSALDAEPSVGEIDYNPGSILQSNINPGDFEVKSSHTAEQLFYETLQRTSAEFAEMTNMRIDLATLLHSIQIGAKKSAEERENEAKTQSGTFDYGRMRRLIAKTRILQSQINDVQASAAESFKDYDAIVENLQDCIRDAEYGTLLHNSKNDVDYLALINDQPLDGHSKSLLLHIQKQERILVDKFEEVEVFLQEKYSEAKLIQRQPQLAYMKQNHSNLSHVYNLVTQHTQIIRKQQQHVANLRLQLQLL
jgi:hypothetical protein